MPIYSLSAAAGAATDAGGGASGTGAAGARAAFGTGGFFAAGAAACAVVGVGAREAAGAAAFAAGAACRVVAVGSGFMMLTGGVDEALGNSALVGLPVGIDGGRPASAAVGGKAAGAVAIAGAFQVGAWRATSVS